MSRNTPTLLSIRSQAHTARGNGAHAGTLSRIFGWIRGRRKEMVGARNGGARDDRQTGARDDPSAAQSAFFEAFNASKGIVLARRVEWAGTSQARRRGLLGRENIDADEGAYIVPTQWIHMFGMRFPIDVAFLDSRGRVLHVCHALEPNRLSPIVWRAEGALELAAGTLLATGTEAGDIIELR
jgi:hypothetical protein